MLTRRRLLAGTAALPAWRLAPPPRPMLKPVRYKQVIQLPTFTFPGNGSIAHSAFFGPPSPGVVWLLEQAVFLGPGPFSGPLASLAAGALPNSAQIQVQHGSTTVVQPPPLLTVATAEGFLQTANLAISNKIAIGAQDVLVLIATIRNDTGGAAAGNGWFSLQYLEADATLILNDLVPNEASLSLGAG